jgi:VWFA-related protein
MPLNPLISRRSLLAALPFLPVLRAQQPAATPAQAAPAQEKPTFAGGVKVVNLFANVRDKNGQFANNLSKDDFLLDEDGRPHSIGYFSQESGLPLTLGLLVDTSISQRRVLEPERSASFRLFDQVLRLEKDEAFVIHFDFEVELLQDVTSSRPLLQKALDNLAIPARQDQQDQSRPRQSPQQSPQQNPYPMPYPFPGGGGRGRGGRTGGPPMDGRGPRRPAAGSHLYDAILLASDELMRKRTGRKALILLTNGVDSGSKVSLTSAIEAAQRADTFVYSILFQDGQNNAGSGFGGNRGSANRPSGKKTLEQIAHETGGRFFEITKKQTLPIVYDQFDGDLRHQYSLGYTPDRTEPDRGFHKIHVTTKQKGLTVQTREGYYGS